MTDPIDPQRLDEIQAVLIKFFAAKTVHTWTTSDKKQAISMPLHEKMQELLLGKIELETGVRISWDELREGLLSLDFNEPETRDSHAATWFGPYRR